MVASLVTHVCSGLDAEVDVALELLCELVAHRPKEMALYGVFIKVGGSPLSASHLGPVSLNTVGATSDHVEYTEYICI